MNPADGLWVAWPKKASKIETDLDFDTVQRIGLDVGLVDNKSAAVDDLLAGAPLRLPPGGPLVVVVRSPSPLPARVVGADVVRVDVPLLRQGEVRSWKRTMSTTGCRVGRTPRRSRARGARRQRVARPLGGPALSLQNKAAHRLVDARKVAVKWLLRCASAATNDPSRSLSAVRAVGQAEPAPAIRKRSVSEASAGRSTPPRPPPGSSEMSCPRSDAIAATAEV